jgi:hypothetical protein
MRRFEDPRGEFFGVTSIHQIVSDIANQRKASRDREFPPGFDPSCILDRWQTPTDDAVAATVTATVPGDEDQVPWGRESLG